MNNVVPTVFLVEDDQSTAQAICWLLDTVGINAETFHNGKSFLNTFDPSRRGCLIIDVRMPEMSGLELQEKLIEKNNRLPIIFITGHGDIPMAVRAMRAGALNFMTKPFNDQMLLDEIQKAITISLKKNEEMDLAKHVENYKQLSSREKVIMSLIVDGKINKQIAQELDISVSTVELHRSNLMLKMNANSLAHLIKLYLALEMKNLLNEN